MKLDNPLSVSEVPELSGKSKIIKAKIEYSQGGVIIEDLDELRRAVRFAGKKYLQSVDEAFELAQEQEVREYHGGPITLINILSVIDEKMERDERENGFQGQDLKDILTKVENEGAFTRSVSTGGGLGSRTSRELSVKKMRDKYIIKLFDNNGTFWGDDETATSELATDLGKPRALYGATIDTELSVVDDWWYNVDFSFLHESLGINRENLREWLNFPLRGSEDKFMEEPKLFFERNDQNYSISPMIIEPAGSGSGYISIRKDFYRVGSAWTTYGWTEDFEHVDGKLDAPKVFSEKPVKVSYPVYRKDKNLNEDPALSDDEKSKFLETVLHISKCFTGV